MGDEALFQERVLKIAATGKHFALLTAPDGGFLRLEDGVIGVDDVADDGAMWLALPGGTYRHATAGRELNATSRAGGGLDLALDGHALGGDGKPSDVPARFTADHGPEQLPSQYLQFFKDHGWVCLTCVVGPNWSPSCSAWHAPTGTPTGRWTVPRRNCAKAQPWPRPLPNPSRYG